MSGELVNPDKPITAAELGPLVGRHPKFIRAMVKAGSLEPFHTSEGGRNYFTLNDYRRQLAENADRRRAERDAS